MAKPVSLTQQLKRRHRIAEQMATQRRELDEIDADIFARFGRLASAIDGESSPPVFTLNPPPGALTGRSHGKAVIVPAVKTILNHQGRPMRTSEIMTALAAMNIPIGGKRPIGNLSAQLSVSNEFSSEGGEWWFRGVQRPTRSQSAHAG